MSPVGRGWHDGVVSTIVFLHAHPDDEASQTAGAMARAVAEGHRVVTVFATNGDHGELPAAGLPDGETLVHWRRREAQASADALGVQRIAWLGYADSGMTGWEQNTHANAFHGADVDEAARRLVGDPRRGGRRRPGGLRLARWLRPPRPRQGAPGRAPRGRAGRPSTAAARVDDEPRHRPRRVPGRGGRRRRRPGLRPRQPDGRRQPARHPRGRDHLAGRHQRLPGPAAGLPRGAPQPGHRHRGDALDARRRSSRSSSAASTTSSPASTRTRTRTMQVGWPFGD